MQDNSALQTVCNAIATLYAGGPASAEAQSFLQHFQESEEAWTICDNIIGLHTDSLACFFAAQTMRTKILKHFKQLPSDSYLSLRNSLLNHLAKHGEIRENDTQSEATSTQLCLAIADLYIQVPSWNNWIGDLLNQCVVLNGNPTVMLLTLLRVFPEELEQMPGIGENRRNAVREELASNGESVLTFLTHVFANNNHNADTLKKMLGCLTSNLRNKAFSTNGFAESPLLQSTLQILTSNSPNLPPSLHEAATDVMIAALVRAEEIEDNYPLAKALQCAVLHLHPAFNEAVAAEDLDRLNNFTRIFVEMNESFCVKMAIEAPTNPEEIGSLACLELLLLSAGHHDFSLIEMSFNVWYRITEELFRIDDDDHVARFRPYVQRFVLALYRHTQLDADEVDIPDPNSEFGEFRAKAIEAVRDVVFILHTSECLNMMYSQLMENCQRPNPAWEETEAALFIMAAVVQNLLPEDDGVMPNVLDSITALPPDSHPSMITTCVALIGDCNEWLETRPAILVRVVRWLLNFAAIAKYAAPVANSLERLTVKCGAEMTLMVPEFMQLIPALQRTNSHGQKVEEAINSLLKACSSLICKLEGPEVTIGFERLCDDIVVNLHAAIEVTPADKSAMAAVPTGENNENDKNAEAWIRLSVRPVLWIDRIASIFREVWKPPGGANGPPAPWLGVASRLFEVLLLAMKKYEDNLRLVEHCCRSLRYLVRSLGLQSIELVGPLVNSMIEIYITHHHSCFLYLASILVDEYGGVDHMRMGLLNMVEVLSNVTFTLLSTEGSINHPDTVDDLFRLAARFANRAPSVFFTHPISSALFNCGISCLKLNHADANKSVSRFFIEVIEQILTAKRRNYSDEGVLQAQKILTENGNRLVAAALNAALFSVTGPLRRDMADVIAITARFDKAILREWLIYAVESLPNDPMKATQEQLNAFVEKTSQEVTLQDILSQMRELGKLFD